MMKRSGGNKQGADQTTEQSADLRTKIAEAAYYRAERRGFVGGDPVEDWLAAENDLLSAAGEVGEPAKVNDSSVITSHRR